MEEERLTLLKEAKDSKQKQTKAEETLDKFKSQLSDASDLISELRNRLQESQNKH